MRPVVIALGLLWAGLAWAGPKEDAKLKKKEGDARLAAGEYEAALAAYEAGAALVRDPLLDLARADVLFKLRRYADAKAAYESFLAVAKPGKQQKEATRAIDALTAILETSLRCEGTPAGAEVVLDSKIDGLRGRLPFVANVAPGPHRVFVSAPGYREREEVVTLARGAAQTVQIALEPSPFVLRVESVPAGAQVLIDGAARGLSPLAIELAPSSYRVELQRDGYLAWRESVRGASGEELALSVALEKEPDPSLRAILRVSANVAGAQIEVDDAPLRAAQLLLDPGPHEVRASAAGFFPVMEKITLAPRGQGALEVELREVPRGAAALRWGGFGGLGVGSVALLLGAGFSLTYNARRCGDLALQIDRDFNGCDPLRVNGILSLAGGGAALIGGAGALWARRTMLQKAARSTIRFREEGTP